MRIGIFGGTFNPIHIAHLIEAEFFRDYLEIDKCVFFPAYTSPFKLEDIDAHSVAPFHRLEMVKLATKSNNRFEVDDYEIRKEGTSYSYDTLQYAIKAYGAEKAYLLIGSDQACDFDKWKNWKEILKLTTLCILKRPGYLEKDLVHFTGELEGTFNKPIVLEGHKLDISASMIRERISNLKSVKYLVPEKVEKYINTHKLYI